MRWGTGAAKGGGGGSEAGGLSSAGATPSTLTGDGGPDDPRLIISSPDVEWEGESGRAPATPFRARASAILASIAQALIFGCSLVLRVGRLLVSSPGKLLDREAATVPRTDDGKTRRSYASKTASTEGSLSSIPQIRSSVISE